jgi:hypothetical protein
VKGKKSVRYGFRTTARFSKSGRIYFAVQAVRPPYNSHRNSGRVFRGNCTAFNSGQAVPYGSLGTENEGAILWFLPVIFKHGKRGRDKFILLVLFLLM